MPVTLDNIIVQYKKSDVCLGELLATIPADGLTLEEAFDLYVDARKHIDGDKYYRQIDSNEPLEEV